MINFLQGLVTDSGSKRARFLSQCWAPSLFSTDSLEEAVELLNEFGFLPCNTACMIFLKSIFRDVHGGRSLSFSRWKTMVILELIITEPQVKVVESAVYLFRNGVSITWRPNSGPYGRRFKTYQWIKIEKRLHFDPTDQTKLSYSLKRVQKRWGQITALTSFLIHDFTRNFILI